MRSKQSPSAHPQPDRSRRSDNFPSRLTPLASAILTSLALTASGSLYAADDKVVAELQAEIARLKQELAAQKVQLAAPAAVTAAPVETVADAPGRAVPAATNEPQALDTVVVRSRNRIERLQDVPLSVSVVTGAELERLGARNFGDITKRAANISWNQGNQRTSSISVRGLGKVGQTEAQDPSVGIIVDGVNYAYNPLTSSFDFTDVEAVEVTRGPQGTLLGKNSSLGTVNITTKRPSFTPSADYSVTFGQNDNVIGRAALGGPIVDNLLAWRGSISFSKGAGPVENRYNPDSTYQNIDRVSGRVQFLLTPTPDFSARLAIDAQPRGGENTNGLSLYKRPPATFANGATFTDASGKLSRSWFRQLGSYSYNNGFLAVNDKFVYNDAQQPVVTGSNGVAAELNWNVGDHTLTSITAYKDYHFNAHNNDEGTPFDIQRSSGQEIYYTQKSQEFRLSSKAGGFVDYQTGLFFINTDTNIRRNVIYGADAGAWFASNSQYTSLNADGAGRLLMQNSLNKLWKDENRQHVNNESQAIFAQANWHLSEPLTLTTGIRFTRENRQNPGSSLIRDFGNAPELNPVSINGVQLGGFSSDASGNLNAGNTATQLALADAAAQKYFGAANYAGLNAAQRQQIANAKAIRQSRMGTLWNWSSPEAFKKVQPAFVISPSYKINDNLTTYVSWQYGEKAGISQQVNGGSYLAKPEKNNTLELGFKSALFDKTLILNADVFYSEIKDYQQSIRVLDPISASYQTTTGNVPKVEVKGLEVDGVFAGIKNTTIRFSGAYNLAKYKEFPNSPKPAEWDNLSSQFYDLSGRTVAGAPKLSFNVGVDYRLPVFGDKEFHSSLNTFYTSKFNSDTALSDYSWIPATTITDFSLGLGKRDKSFDVSLLVKNLFNQDKPVSQTLNTSGTITGLNYQPAVPRWIGVVFTGKL